MLVDCSAKLKPMKINQNLSLDFTKPNIMGIINTGKESFCGTNRICDQAELAAQCALDMVAAGATIIDVGGEPTNPQQTRFQLSEAHEIARVVPTITAIRQRTDITISVDTSRPQVMAAAIAAGANIINDVRALRLPGAMAMAASLQVPVCLMHMSHPLGLAQRADDEILGDNPLDEIKQFFSERIAACEQADIARDRIILDPGFGGGSFGKTDTQNLAIVRDFQALTEFGMPLMLGVSRKSTIGNVLQVDVSERLYGSIGLTLLGIMNGANIIRTHDVLATQQAITMMMAALEGGIISG